MFSGLMWQAPVPDCHAEHSRLALIFPTLPFLPLPPSRP